MKFNLVNKNVDHARFEICWDSNDSKPSIALNAGDMASFDMDVFNQIPEGANWWIKCYQITTGIFKCSTEKFKYIRGKGFCGTFDLLMQNLDITIEYHSACERGPKTNWFAGY